MTSNWDSGHTSLTYKDAGVDIDAGEALVERIGLGGQTPRAGRARTRTWAALAGCLT